MTTPAPAARRDRPPVVGRGGGLYVLVGTVLLTTGGVLVLRKIDTIARANPEVADAALVGCSDRWWLILLLALPAFLLGLNLIRRNAGRPFISMLFATVFMFLPLIPVGQAFWMLISGLYEYQDIG